MFTRKASAVWQGGLKDGKGALTTASGVLSSTPYSFTTRFEDVQGTNPEELVAAAHAGCFSMALSAELGGAGLSPERIDTSAEVAMEKREEGWTVISVRLQVRAKVPGADDAAFKKATEAAKRGCPISRLLKAEITMDAALVR